MTVYRVPPKKSPEAYVLAYEVIEKLMIREIGGRESRRL